MGMPVTNLRILDSETTRGANDRARKLSSTHSAARRPFSRAIEESGRHPHPAENRSWMILGHPHRAASAVELDAVSTAIEAVLDDGGGELVVCVCYGPESSAVPTRTAAEEDVLAYVDDLRSQPRLIAQTLGWNAVELRAVVYHLGSERFYEYDTFQRQFVPMPHHATERIM
jgi:hypothetical protein